MPCESLAPLTPYTRSTAHAAGWQRRIPRQNRIGSGHVDCSRFISHGEAAAVLLKNLDGKALADPRPVRNVTGKHKKFWNRNVVAIGLSSGFIEPLESTSIHLIQMGIARLMNLFPDLDFDAADIAKHYRQTKVEFEQVRDFVILHDQASARDDSPFWNHCRTMAIPDGLRHRIELFRGHGRVFRTSDELFAENSWIQVMLGQGIVPGHHHLVADLMGDEEPSRFLDEIRDQVNRTVAQLPTHRDDLQRYGGRPSQQPAKRQVGSRGLPCRGCRHPCP